jgi:hypothetical protein
MSRKKAFQPEDEDARLDALATRRGFGSLGHETATRGAASSRRPEVKLTVVLPSDVVRALRLKAAEDGVTMRYLLLVALRDSQYPVIDDDLIEDRRSRQ